jgi:hypothetical protein
MVATGPEGPAKYQHSPAVDASLKGPGGVQNLGNLVEMGIDLILLVVLVDAQGIEPWTSPV